MFSGWQPLRKRLGVGGLTFLLLSLKTFQLAPER